MQSRQLKDLYKIRVKPQREAKAPLVKRRGRKGSTSRPRRRGRWPREGERVAIRAQARGGQGPQEVWYPEWGGKGKGWQGPAPSEQYRGKGVGGKGGEQWGFDRPAQGLGKGVGSAEQASSSSALLGDRNVCWRCEREGKPSNHDWRACRAQPQVREDPRQHRVGRRGLIREVGT